MATRNNFTRNFVLVSALIFLVAIGFSNVSAVPGLNGTSPFDFNGTIYFANGTAANGVNVSVKFAANSNPTASGTSTPPERTEYNILSDANGFFNFSITLGNLPINASPWYLWDVRMRLNTSGATVNVTHIGNLFSSMDIRTMMEKLSNGTFYLQPAIQLNFTNYNTRNLTGLEAYTDFNYTIVDNALGIVVVGNATNSGRTEFFTNVTNVTLPKFRSSELGKGYTIVVWKNYFGANFSESEGNSTAPTAFYLSNLSNYNSTAAYVFNLNSSLSSILYVGNFTGDNYSVYSNKTPLNFTGSQKYVYLAHNGNITLADYGFDNLSIVRELYGPLHIQWQSLGASLAGNFNVSAPVYRNDTGLGPGLNQSYILAGFANTQEGYYGGFVNLSEGVFSPSLRSGAQQVFVPSVGMRKIGGTFIYADTNATKVIFNIVNTTNVTALSGVFKYQVEVTYNISTNNSPGVDILAGTPRYNTQHIVWTGTTNATGHFAVPLWVSESVKVRLYHSAYQPMEYFISAGNLNDTTIQTVNNGMINLTIQNNKFVDPDDGCNHETITTDIYNASNTFCLNATLNTAAEACTISNRFSQFTTRASINLLNTSSGNVTMRQAFANNMQIIFKNIDLTLTGAPAVEVDSTATITKTNQYRATWKVGSFAPKETYGSVQVGFPYSDSDMDDTAASISVNISKIYNANWATIWDNSVNGTSPNTALPELSGMNSTIFTNGVLCSVINPEELCFVNM